MENVGRKAFHFLCFFFLFLAVSPKNVKTPPFSWRIASGFCSREKEHLVSLNTPAEWKLVTDLVYGFRQIGTVFIGLKSAGHKEPHM